MKPNHLKNLLLSEIKSVSEKPEDYCVSSGKDFTRHRKLSFETVMKISIGMESGSLTNEIIDAFHAEPNLPSTAAFVQQRYKIKPEAFKAVFDGFTSRIINVNQKDIRVLAVDGSDVQIATNPDDLSSFHPGSNGQKPYNLLHLNAFFDLNQKIYWARKVVWAANQVINAGGTLSWVKISRLIHMRRRYFEACLPYICDYANEELAQKIKNLSHSQ